jgi:hypothetical protein
LSACRQFSRLHGDRCMWDSLLARDRVWNQRGGSVTIPDVGFMTTSMVKYSYFCLWLVNTKTSCKERREEAGKAASEKLKEQLGEGRGDAQPNPKPSHNLDLRSLRPLPKERGVGSGVKNPEKPKQQPSKPNHELTEFYRREQERHSGVLENPIRVSRPLPRKTGEQRGELEPSQPNPGEAVVFHRGSSHPDQEGQRRRKRNPLPRSTNSRKRRLSELLHEEIRLPGMHKKEFTPEEEAKSQEWVNSLTRQELGREIRKQEERLNQEFRDQMPPPNSLLRV